jgi:hypothetical protein
VEGCNAVLSNFCFFVVGNTVGNKSSNTQTLAVTGFFANLVTLVTLVTLLLLASKNTHLLENKNRNKKIRVGIVTSVTNY